MPVLPGIQQRLTPEPSAAVARYQGGIAEHAQIHGAEATARIGGDLVQLADQRRGQLDELRVIEASTDLRKQEMALTFDEKEGYQAIKGGDVIKRPIVQDYAAKYKEAVDRVSASLSPHQREMFAGHAAGTSMNFQANVMRHAMAETEKYGGEVYKADLLSRYDTAGMAYKNAMVTNSQLEGIDAATHRRMDLQGVNDPALRGEFVKAARGGLHATVIDKAITSGDTEFANEYFKANKVDMTGDQINMTERQLKPATDFALGKAIASDAFRKEVEDPQFNAATWMAEKAGSNPQAMAAAHSMYTQFVHEKKTAETEQLGTIFKQFYANPNSPPNRATMNAIVNTPAFRNMNDTQQASALHTMASAVQSAEDRTDSKAYQAEARIYQAENRQYQREAHADALERRTEQKLADSLPAVTKTNQVVRDPGFSKMKPEELYGMAPEIGIDNVKYLLGRQAQTNKELNNFQMDHQIVEGAKPPSAMKNKVQSKAIEEMAELEGQKFIQTNGVKPDREQQVEIMRKVTSESISKPGMLWGTNEKKLYEMSPDQRNFYLGIQAAAEKSGRPELTDAQLVSAWDLSQKNKSAKPTSPAVVTVAPVTAVKSDPAFKARQVALQKAHEEGIAATNKKTEELKAQLVTEEAKLSAMDANLNERVKGFGSSLRNISDARPEQAAHKAMTAEIEAKSAPAGKEDATVSAYGVDDKVEVAEIAKAEKAMDKTVEQIIKTPSNILTPPAKGGTILKDSLKTTKPPSNFSRPVEGTVTPTKSHTGGAGGITIEAAAGAAVKAAASGVVKFVGAMRRYGEVVIVEHSGGYMTVYGHNQGVTRKVGDAVRRGDQIGSAEGGPTLFEVRHKGVTVDPMKWLKKKEH